MSKLTFADLRNESGNDFVDISSEQNRQYQFKGSEVVAIDEPIALSVSRSGGHRVLDAAGVCHYVPSGWIRILWKVKSGQPHFVK